MQIICDVTVSASGNAVFRRNRYIYRKTRFSGNIFPYETFLRIDVFSGLTINI